MDGARSLDSGYPHPFHRASANLLCMEETSSSIGGRKSQISNSKSQINSKLQFQMTKTGFVSNLADWDLFKFWCLGFGAYIGSLIIS